MTISYTINKSAPLPAIFRPDYKEGVSKQRHSVKVKQAKRDEIEQLTAEWLEREGLDEVPVFDPKERTGACDLPKNFQLGVKRCG